MLSFRLRRKQRTIAMHIAAWVIFILFGTLNKVARNPKAKIDLLDIVATEILSVYVFYGSNYVFSRFLPKRRYTLLLVGEVVFFVSYLLISYVNGYLLTPLINPGFVPPPFRLGGYLISCSWVFFLYSYFSFGYYYALQAIKKEKELRISEAKKLQAEKDTLAAEYSYLRSQINPHFLHNTLNFFYAKSLDASEELSDGILTLSELMRYSLEAGDTQDGKVRLSREVDSMKKVIKINRLRFSNHLNIELVESGDLESICIIPLVLVTLLENALKHGELNNLQHPIRIRIEVDNERGRFFFRISNRKKRGPKESGHGIGMENVKKRLKYTYQQNHRLEVKDEGDLYSVELTISLTNEDHWVGIAWSPT